jgi:hypothetical protein
MIWALVKNRVAMDWVPNRKMREVQEHLWNAFYGGPKQNIDGDSWTPVDGEACTACIRKCCHNARERINWDLRDVPEDEIQPEDQDDFDAADPWENENDDDVYDDSLTDAAGVDDVEEPVHAIME